MNNVIHLRNKNILIGNPCTFVTAGGIFSGVITSIEGEGNIYELKDVTFRPAGSFNVQLKLDVCEVYGTHIVASLPLLDKKST